MTSIVEFLEARWTEIEAAANAAIEEGGKTWEARSHPSETAMVRIVNNGQPLIYDEGAPGDAEAVHIALHDPERELKVIEANRAILALNLPAVSCDHDHPQYDVYHPDGHGPHPVYRIMAAAFDQHPDYQEEWAL